MVIIHFSFQPENAIAVYETALSNSDSNDVLLSSKIGKALITTHDYAKVLFQWIFTQNLVYRR